MKNIYQFLTDQVERHQTPSVQYAFFDLERTQVEFRHGLKNIRLQQPVHALTTYHLFSITKTFTALAMLQLAEAGKIELKNPAVQYLPDFPYPDTITVEHLLNHTSGIPNPMPLRWIHAECEHTSFQHDAFFTDVFRQHAALSFTPGTRFQYSNLGYVLLGQLIEQVSGQLYEDYVTTHIFKRCGIDNGELRFTMDPSTHATGYHKRFSITGAVLPMLVDTQKFMGHPEGRWKPFTRFYNNGKAYGGAIGSVKGLIRYAQALLHEHSVLLGDRYKHRLFDETRIGGKPTGMSLSWFTGELKGNHYVAHAGGGGGYYVELRLYPGLQAGSVIVYNRSGMRDERMLDKTDRFFLTERMNFKQSS